MKKHAKSATLFLFLLVIAVSLIAEPCRAAVSLDQGWRLLLDTQAAWQNDTLYLPDDVKLSALPVNAPTGGWDVLNPSAGIAVTLPASVEQYYWGKTPNNLIDPRNLDAMASADGSYHGVSWWYRPFEAPVLKPGERLILHFPGARLRAEVYVNRKLVAYNIVGETPIDADITDAVTPGGSNLLAVRITNPGGERGWGDNGTMRWGAYDLPVTHSVGGLDGGVTMDIRGPVAVTDLAVLNNPDPKTVTLVAELTSTGPAFTGQVSLAILHKGAGIWSGKEKVSVPAGGQVQVLRTVTVGSAILWDIGQPNLYTATATISSIAHSDRATTFGFRWFTATGIGTNATLRLNGRRVVVKSAISWGWWAPNGMFPDASAAQRDAAAAQAIGLNCVQNHRHTPKPISLDAFDRAGLMYYLEPGGGGMTYADSTAFASNYEMAKILAMIKADRSHPSVVIWNLQNENSRAPNAKLYDALRKMHEVDPSRIIVSQSGFEDHNMVWFLPQATEPSIDKHDGKGAGWDDRHTAGDSRGAYEDGFYRSPDDFRYRTDNAQEISMWGEMATGASPDDHDRIESWYKSHNLNGYDRMTHQSVIAGYDRFLDHYGLRSSFPTSGTIFRQAANLHYFEAARILENARICDNNDYIVLSGWESTSVDNHSGLVDELHNPKTDPAQIKEAAAPAVLVIEPRHLVVAQGDSATCDIHLVNEGVLSGKYALEVDAVDAAGKSLGGVRADVDVSGGEVFAQLLKRDIVITPKEAGYTTINARLSTPSGVAVLTRSSRIYVVDTNPAPIRKSCAVVGDTHFGDMLTREFGIAPVPSIASAGTIDNIVIAPEVGSRSEWHRTILSDEQVQAPSNRGLYTQQSYGRAGQIARFDKLANGASTVDLYFIEPYWDSAGKRLFDVALNGANVLTKFDIFQEAGGKNIPLVRSFLVDVKDGTISLTVPVVEIDNAIFCAVRITDSSGHVMRRLFGTRDYRDADHNRWLPIVLFGFDWDGLDPDVFKRVHDDGSRLIILSNDADAEQAAGMLASRGIVAFNGMVGASEASWMGRWYFGKKHWLLDGLPSDCVLDWQYQIAGGNGFWLDAPGLEAVVGYGVNHGPNPGLGCAVIPYGKGEIVLYCIPGLEASFSHSAAMGIDPVTAKRMIFNVLVH